MILYSNRQLKTDCNMLILVKNNTNKDIDKTTERKSDIVFSALVDLFNLNSFSISPEIKYIQKGVGFKLIITGSDGPAA